MGSVAGFDFMAKGQAHHGYHMGLLAEGTVDRLHLHSSCTFSSVLRDLYGIGRLHYRSTLATYISMLRFGLIDRGKVMVVGINSGVAWLLLPLLVLRPRSVTIHLHGQIVSIRNPLKRLWWRAMSLLAVLEVPNPIFEGPAWITSVPHPCPPTLIDRAEERPRICLLYGGNKDWLRDEMIRQRITNAGYSIDDLVAGVSPVDFNEIVSHAFQAGYTFVRLDAEHYALSPSGRLADLRMLDLVPLVLVEDAGTQSVLAGNHVRFEVV